MQTAQVSSPPPSLPPSPSFDLWAAGQLGLLGVLAALVLKTFLQQHTNQQNDSWELLEKLVANQQDTLKTLAVTNQELTLRLARVHERLEHLERLIEGSKHHGPS
jgi:hypothetical protein